MWDLFKKFNEVITDSVAMHGTYNHTSELTDLGNEEAEGEHYARLGRSIVYNTLLALEQHGYNQSRGCEQPMSRSYLDQLEYFEKVST